MSKNAIIKNHVQKKKIICKLKDYHKNKAIMIDRELRAMNKQGNKKDICCPEVTVFAWSRLGGTKLFVSELV